ncbi:MAG: M14 family metallopeptidase [Ignavibacteriales bacterium]|nr:M14 family metallopeptidase [Ignavibacteriales bacterium]
MKRLLFALLITCSAYAQRVPEFFPGGTHNRAVITPESVLGYEIGERFTTHASINAVFDKLVASSDRIRRVPYGETNEHRSLQVFIVSSPGNLGRLEEIRRANIRLTDPRTFQTKGEAEAIMSTLPVIVYLSYGVHGNEASSPEAAMAVAYQLCAGTDSRTQSILENAIVIIDPNVNPDGHERYVQWVNSVLGTKPNLNPSSLEHSESWPGGRTNHYFFDLNRDLSWQTQQETRARVQLYRTWMPHVHVDYHEMGYSSSYFFFPAAVPVHESLPSEVLKWGKIFGKGNAEAFDKLGLSYYVGEQFDMFYPGYGDSWPTFNGAVGMTYEQAGGSRASLAVRKPNGEILTLRHRARNHFVTSIATLETSVTNKKERIEDFYGFWITAPQSVGLIKGYLISNTEDPTRSNKVIETLLRQGIEVHQLTDAVALQVQEYYTSKWTREKIPKGTYFVSTVQPQARLVKTLLEPVTAVRDTFFYDVSAWSLPIASGLKAWASQSPLPSASIRIDAPVQTAGRIIGDKHAYAYLIPWQRNGAVQLVWQLLERGHALSVARRPFETAGQHFVAGTVVAFAGSNGDSLADDIETLAKTLGVDVYSAATGLTDNGISLGSSYIAPMKKANIAIAAGPPVSSNDYGELWFLFERELHMPFTGVRTTELADADLSKFDVIILPDASNYQSAFDSAKTEKLKRWIQNGGVLIGIEGGAQFMTKGKSGITGASPRAEKKEDEKSKEEKEQEKSKKELSKRQTLFEKEEKDRLGRIPGTIFRVLVDTTHPIGFGVPREIYVLKNDALPLDLSETGHNVARFAKDSVQTSGYATKEKAQKISESAYIQDFRIGRGRAVLFAENITFRRFWSGLEKLLLNSILFLPQPD